MSDIRGNPMVSCKLAAILAADIAGYRRSWGSDGEASVRDLKGAPVGDFLMIEEHGGRVIDTAGDGILSTT
jgi:adenylate cyclase